MFFKLIYCKKNYITFLGIFKYSIILNQVYLAFSKKALFIWQLLKTVLTKCFTEEKYMCAFTGMKKNIYNKNKIIKEIITIK